MQVRLSEQVAEAQLIAPERPQPLHDPFAYFLAVVRESIKPAADLSSLENNLIVDSV